MGFMALGVNQSNHSEAPSPTMPPHVPVVNDEQENGNQLEENDQCGK